MIKSIAIIFLVTLFNIEQPTEKDNLYSWQITFNDFAQCESFFNEYGDKLMNGVIDHAKREYNKDMQIEYLSCAKVEIDANNIQIDLFEKPVLNKEFIMKEILSV